MPKFRTKNALIGYFKISIAIFEISTLKFVKNEFLTHTLIFVGSAFSKGWKGILYRYAVGKE